MDERFWRVENWEETDPNLQRLKGLPFQRQFPQQDFSKGLYLIRGPRQIGKTSWLKTLLKSFVELFGPDQCFFLSCENIRDQKELAEFLKSLSSHRVVLLDEITFVPGWAKAVKHEIDRGGFHTLIVTGSNAADLRAGGERLPGRFGDGRDIELLPMDFYEFQSMRKMAGWAPLNRVAELELFFRVGGFPLALLEAGSQGDSPIKAQNICRQWLAGDILKLGKQEVYLQEILGQIALSMGTAISLQTLAQKTQMGSHHTALSYVEILQDCFALRTLYAIDPNTGGLRFRKEKKFYFSDPILYWLALDWSGIEIPANPFAQLAEMVAHEMLTRNHQRFGYFHSKQGEIDFFKKGQWALEVKWSDLPRNLSGAYKNLVIPWKTIWLKNNFLNEMPPK